MLTWLLLGYVLVILTVITSTVIYGNADDQQNITIYIIKYHLRRR